MHRKDKSTNLHTAAFRWLRTSPNVVALSMLIGVAVVALGQWMAYHEPSLAPLNERPWWRDVDKPTLAYVYDYIRPYLRLIALLGSVSYSISLIRAYPNVHRMVLPTSIVCILLASWALADEAYAYWEMGNARTMGEPFLPWCYAMKLVLMTIAILSPPFVLAWYAQQKVLDRYTLKNFLQPLVFCFAAFASLFVLMDLIDNMKDFQESNIPMRVVLSFYLNLFPYIYVLIMPAALLLAVLYALTRMSRSNEIVSMLTAGRSLGQVLKPMLVVTAYASVLGLIANYHWAPRGEGRRNLLTQGSGEEKKLSAIAQAGVMHHNDKTHRTWFIGAMPFDPRNERISQIEVRQLDEKGRLLKGWYGTSGRWIPETGEWVLMNGVQFNYRNGVASQLVPFENMGRSTRMIIKDWSETPWSIISASLLPDNLGVHDLQSFLDTNDTASEEKRASFSTHLAHRFAYPMQSLVLVFMAAPLSVSFSRRGALGGIIGSVLMFFGLMFLNNLFINLGKGAHMPAVIAVWMPHLIVGAVAVFIFNMRSNNRDLPAFAPKKWAKQAWQFVSQRLFKRSTPQPAR